MDLVNPPPPPPKKKQNQNHWFPLSSGFYSRPKTGIEDNSCTNFWGVNKMHYGVYENGEF